MGIEEAIKTVRKEISLKKKQLTKPDEISNRVKQLINYSIDRSDYYEEYRNKYLTLSTQLILFSISFLTLVYNFVSPFPVLIFFGTAILFGMSLLNVYLYLKESIYPNYPHLSVANVSWYYLYNLKKMDKKSKSYKGTKNEQAKQYLLDLYQNIEKKCNETQEDQIMEDVEQLSILYVITAYKVRFSSRMRKILAFGILSFGIFSALHLLTLII